MEKTGCKIICGAPTSLAVKGLIMMMMMMMTMMMMMINETLLFLCCSWRRRSKKKSRACHTDGGDPFGMSQDREADAGAGEGGGWRKEERECE